MELDEQLAHLAERGLGHRRDLLERRRRHPGVAVAAEHRQRRAGAEDDAVDRLGHGVVELARQPLALLLDGAGAGGELGDGVGDRAEVGDDGRAERGAGEEGHHPDGAPVDDQGVAGEGDDAGGPGPVVVVDAGVVSDVVGHDRPPLGGDAADLQLAHAEAAVGAVEVGVEPGARAQPQGLAVRLEHPDPREGRPEVLDHRLRAELEHLGRRPAPRQR